MNFFVCYLLSSYHDNLFLPVSWDVHHFYPRLAMAHLTSSSSRLALECAASVTSLCCEVASLLVVC
jgi:hypothetical protein